MKLLLVPALALVACGGSTPAAETLSLLDCTFDGDTLTITGSGLDNSLTLTFLDEDGAPLGVPLPLAASGGGTSASTTAPPVIGSAAAVEVGGQTIPVLFGDAVRCATRSGERHPPSADGPALW